MEACRRDPRLTMIGAMTALPQTRITVDEYLAWAAENARDPGLRSRN